MNPRVEMSLRIYKENIQTRQSAIVQVIIIVLLHYNDSQITVTQVLPFTAQNFLLAKNLATTERELDIESLYIPRSYRNTETGEEVTHEDQMFSGRRATLVKAGPGMGKTTLYRYLINMWALGNRLRQFQIVINFSCR